MLEQLNALNRASMIDPEDRAQRARFEAERARVFGTTTPKAGLLPPDAVLAYVLAGRATFTLHSRRTNRHITYRVNRRFDDEADRSRRYLDEWDVSCMTGTDNTSSYSPMGRIDSSRAFTVAGSFGAEDPAALAFRFMLELAKRHQGHSNLGVWHHGRCGCCARDLTVPDSIERGIGPVCAAKATTSQRATLKTPGESGRRSFEETFLALVRSRNRPA